MATPASNRSPRTAARWLFVMLVGFYALFTSGHIDTPDGVVMYEITRSMVDRGELTFSPLPGSENFGGPAALATSDGAPRRYSKYGVGLSLACIPMYGLSRLLLPLAGQGEQQVFLTPSVVEGRSSWQSSEPTEWGDQRSFRRLWYDAADFEESFGALLSSWTNAFMGAGIAAMILLLLTDLGVGLRAATLTALLVGLGSPLWHYATVMFAEPLATLLLLVATRALLRRRAGGGEGWMFVLGLAMGGIGLTKIALLSLGLPLGVALALGWRGRLSLAVREIALAGAGLLLPIAIGAAYNLARFGVLGETGYGEEARAWSNPFLEGFLGLLLSPGRGALLYCPAIFLGYALLPQLWQRSREAAVVAGLTLPVLVLLYARWWMWEGGWCWGPRFLLPGVLVALLPIGLLDLNRLPRRAQVGVSALLLASVLVATSAMLVNFHDYHQWAKRWFIDHAGDLLPQGIDYNSLIRWDWHFSPLLAYPGFPVKDYLLLTSAVATPGLVLALFGLAGIAATWGLVKLSPILRAPEA